jgi:hypothetical protein
MSQTTQGLGLTEWSAATDYYNHVQLAQNWTLVDSQVLKKTWSVPNYDEATLVKFFGTANTPILMASASGSAYPFYTIYGAGSVVWGPGNLTPDTNLYRSGSALLDTDSSFYIGKNLTVAGTAGVFGNFVSGPSTASSLNVTGNATVAGTTNIGNMVATGTVSVGNGLGVTGNVTITNQISALSGTVTTLNVGQLNAGLVVGNSTATNLQANQLTIQGSPGNASITNGLTVGSINNNGGGITNTGSLAGVTTISASSAVSTGALTSTSHNNNGGGITNAGAISGVTTINSHTVNGNLTISGGSVSGATTVNGATISGGTLSGGTLTSTQVNGVNLTTSGISGIGTLTVTGVANLGPNSIFTAPVETVSIVTSQIGSGTIALNTATSGFFLYNNPSGPAGPYTINITGPGTNLATGQSITVAFAVWNGSSAAYYPTTYQIDGSTANVNIYWGNNSPPAAADTSTYDVYTFSVIKTAASTYTVFAQQSKF